MKINDNGVYREMTPEEIEEMELEQIEIPEPEPTVEEQLADLSEYVSCLTDFVLGGNK